MDLQYKVPPENAGGSALAGCGVIHRTEIGPTLTALSTELGLSFDLNDFTVGSTGKRDYSGDVDLVIDDAWWTTGVTEFALLLSRKYGHSVVTVNGLTVHLKYPISNYDIATSQCNPRTGFVQIDFNIGNPVWERFYHYSPGAASGYKGAHRNLALAAITFIVNKEESATVDSYNRPVWENRYKWSPTGFVRVHRESRKDPRTNVWMKKQIDTVLSGPYFDSAVISGMLFPLDGTKQDLNSLETIMAAVCRNYDRDIQEKIWERIALNFWAWKDGRNFTYPTEISKYLPADDK